ncbi:MAG TPA: hypothetical protein PLC72_18695 [Candidatus Hydrogenedentes bacterium]|nr:hypothetical protein [Candidatus Hydrogenedentota bacterium]
MGESKRSRRALIALDREEKIWELRKSGATYLQCGRAVGLSESGAFLACKRRYKKIDATCTEEAQHRRTLEAEQLKALLIKLQPGIAAGDVNAIREARCINESYRKLFGDDAPAKSEVSGPNAGPCIIHVVYDDKP